MPFIFSLNTYLLRNHSGGRTNIILTLNISVLAKNGDFIWLAYVSTKDLIICDRIKETYNCQTRLPRIVRDETRQKTYFLPITYGKPEIGPIIGSLRREWFWPERTTRSERRSSQHCMYPRRYGAIRGEYITPSNAKSGSPWKCTCHCMCILTHTSYAYSCLRLVRQIEYEYAIILSAWMRIV